LKLNNIFSSTSGNNTDRPLGVFILHINKLDCFNVAKNDFSVLFSPITNYSTRL